MNNGHVAANSPDPNTDSCYRALTETINNYLSRESIGSRVIRVGESLKLYDSQMYALQQEVGRGGELSSDEGTRLGKYHGNVVVESIYANPTTIGDIADRIGELCADGGSGNTEPISRAIKRVRIVNGEGSIMDGFLHIDKGNVWVQLDCREPGDRYHLTAGDDVYMLIPGKNTFKHIRSSST